MSKKNIWIMNLLCAFCFLFAAIYNLISGLYLLAIPNALMFIISIVCSKDNYKRYKGH